MKLVTGDRFFQWTPTILSRVIEWFQTRRWEPKTFATHEGVFALNKTNQMKLYQAHFGAGFRSYDIDKYINKILKKGGRFKVFRNSKLTHLQKAHINRTCQNMDGMGYASLEIPLQALDELRSARKGKRVFFWRKLGDLNKHNVICSKGGNIPFIELGLQDPITAYYNPDDSMDMIEASPDWALVYEQPPVKL